MASDAVRDKVFALINAERANFNVDPLTLDDTVSTIANAHAHDMGSNNYTSNWSLSGIKPYQRYYASGKGIDDHVTELVFGVEAEESEKFNYLDEAFILEKVALARESFGAREAPPVGNKDHTHVGFGISITKDSFRYVEVFVDRYVEILDPLPENIVGSEGKVLCGGLFHLLKN